MKRTVFYDGARGVDLRVSSLPASSTAPQKRERQSFESSGYSDARRAERASLPIPRAERASTFSFGAEQQGEAAANSPVLSVSVSPVPESPFEEEPRTWERIARVFDGSLKFSEYPLSPFLSLGSVFDKRASLFFSFCTVNLSPLQGSAFGRFLRWARAEDPVLLRSIGAPRWDREGCRWIAGSEGFLLLSFVLLHLFPCTNPSHLSVWVPQDDKKYRSGGNQTDLVLLYTLPAEVEEAEEDPRVHFFPSRKQAEENKRILENRAREGKRSMSTQTRPLLLFREDRHSQVV